MLWCLSEKHRRDIAFGSLNEFCALHRYQQAAHAVAWEDADMSVKRRMACEDTQEILSRLRAIQADPTWEAAASLYGSDMVLRSTETRSPSGLSKAAAELWQQLMSAFPSFPDADIASAPSIKDDKEGLSTPPRNAKREVQFSPPRPSHARRSTGEAGEVKQETTAHAPGVHRHNMDAEALEKAFLASHPRDPPVMGHLLHYGTLLHGIAEISRHRWGVSWPAHCLPLMATSAESSRLLALSSAGLVFAILQNKEHWALLAGMHGKSTWLLLDSRPSAEVEQLAAAFLLHAQETSWRQELSLRKYNVPLQPDSWSCGFRVLMSAKAIIELEGGDWPPQIPTAAFSEETMSAMCRDLRAWMDPSAVAAKPEGSAASAPHRKTEAAAASGAQGSASASASEKPPTTPKRQSLVLHASPSSRSTPRMRVRRLSKAPKAKASRRKQAPEAKAKQTEAELQQKGLEILENIGVDHSMFQAVHRRHFPGKNTAKGHWQTFQKSIADDRIISCEACLELQAKVSQALEDAEEQALSSLVPAEEADKPGLSRTSKKGRKRKADEAGRRWLHEFIRSERPGLYRVTDASYSPQVEYWCTACQEKVRFWTSANNSKLLVHEKAKKHERGLRRLRCEQEERDRALMPLPAADEIVESDQSGCRGIAVQDPSSHKAGQPRIVYSEQEADPLQGLVFEYHPRLGILVSSTQCVRKEMSPKETERGYCDECLKRCQLLSLRKHLCKLSYWVDLLLLTWKMKNRPRKEAEEMAQVMRSRDYIALKLEGTGLEGLLEGDDSFQKLLCATKRGMESVAQSRRSTSMRHLIERFRVTVPVTKSGKRMQKDAETALAATLADAITSGTCREKDVHLASLVATGGLRGDSVVEALTATFLLEFQQLCSNKRRKTSSKHIREAHVADALSTLGRTSEIQELMQRFGLNARAVPKKPVIQEAVPESFCSHRTDELLRTAAEKILRLLRLEGDTEIRPMLIMDDSDQDFSYVQVTDSNEVPQIRNMPQAFLANTTQHYVMKRPDCSRFVFDLLCIPGKQTSSGRDLLELTGRVMQAATSRSLVPPIGVSSDCGTRNMETSRCLVGLCDPADLTKLPFWSTCERKPLTGPYAWPFGALFWTQPSTGKSFQLAGSCGGWHVQKRFSLAHVSGCRLVSWGAFWVTLSPCCRQDLGTAAFCCKDVQSDSAASSRLAPCFTPRAWDAVGTHLHQLVGGLVAAITTASRGLTKSELAHSSFCLYYVVMLHLCRASTKHPQQTDKYCLSKVTVRNLAHLAAHSVNQCQMPWEHRDLQELPIEVHFSRVKSSFRGSPGIRDCIAGISLDAMKQLLELRRLPEGHDFNSNATVQDRTPVTPEQLTQISKEALACCCKFQAMISVDVTAEDIYDHFRSWFRVRGLAVLQARTEDLAGTGDAEDSLEHLLEQKVDEVTDLALLAGVDTTVLDEPLATVELLQARAVQAEETEATLDALLQLDDPEQEQHEQATSSGDAAADFAPSAFPDGLLPDEPPDHPEELQPKTLADVVNQAIVKDPAAFELNEISGAGEEGCLKRALCLVGPIRRYTRWVRLEEGKLSEALLERKSQGQKWNVVEHELALARRIASLSHTRVSRAEAWAKTAAEFLKEKLPVPKSSSKDGLVPVTSFRPPVSGRTWQVLVLCGSQLGASSKILLGVTLTVFRGSVNRKQGQGPVQVRAGRAFNGDLPTNASRVVHAAELRATNDDTQGTFTVTGLSNAWVFDPTGVVLAEPELVMQKETKHGFTVQLSEAALQGIEILRKSKLPKLAAASAADPAEDGAAEHAEPSSSLSEGLQFTDRSFTKTTLRKSLDRFWPALARAYAQEQQPFVDANDSVQLGEQQLSFKDLASRSATFLEKEFENSRGWTFSQRVHSFLQSLLPKRRISAS
ncbi:unnamed protein product [Symbiodinium sp. CCMP2592]|nr:unnamed protein product [Symbiodinium sp. CCMP2592]